MPDDSPQPPLLPTDQPLEPTFSAVVSPPAGPVTQQPVVTMRPSRGALFRQPAVMAGLGVVVVVLVGAGLVFGLYLPNTPGGVYDASLHNTAVGIDTLLDYSKTQNDANYKSASYDGSLTLKSPSGSVDATLSGASDSSGDADLAFTADILGQKGSANLRTIHVAGTTSPDIYLQVSGIKSLLQSTGMNALSSLDGQWIAIDHTRLDTYAARLKATQSAPSTSTALAAPTYVQIDDAARRVQVVNKTYLFTTDASTAVLQQQKFVGTETVDGRPMNHYLVGYDKTHFAAYIDALKATLDASKLNAWAVATSGLSLSKTLDLDSTKASIASAKSDYTFDLWTDNQTRAVSKVSFTDPSDSSSSFSISQSHTGGSQYPLLLTATSKDDTGKLGLTLDTATHKLTFTFNLVASASDGTTTVAATMDATPSNNPVSVVAPTGAKPLTEILNSLGLGALLSSSSAAGLGSQT